MDLHQWGKIKKKHYVKKTYHVKNRGVNSANYLFNQINRVTEVPANKKPHCIGNKSQFSYKTMDKTIGYCSKTIGCTLKSGFLFVGTRCG